MPAIHFNFIGLDKLTELPKDATCGKELVTLMIFEN